MFEPALPDYAHVEVDSSYFFLFFINRYKVKSITDMPEALMALPGDDRRSRAEGAEFCHTLMRRLQMRNRTDAVITSNIIKIIFSIFQ
jgi:hypothetical protein